MLSIEGYSYRRCKGCRWMLYIKDGFTVCEDCRVSPPRYTGPIPLNTDTVFLAKNIACRFTEPESIFSVLLTLHGLTVDDCQLAPDVDGQTITRDD